MILLIDFEATGIDPKTARIIEVGAQLVDEKWFVLESFNNLMFESNYPAITAEVEKVTGITQDQLFKTGISPKSLWENFSEVFSQHDIKWVIAYNRSYDEVLFKEEITRGLHRRSGIINSVFEAPWLCAMADIESNYQYKSWRQSHLALEYGITVNPKLLHRAIGDVELMRQILVESWAAPENMYEFQQEPWIYVRADVKPPWEDNGRDVAKAKEYGFSWEGVKQDPDKKYPKTWVKRIKKRWLEKELNYLDLKVREV